MVNIQHHKMKTLFEEQIDIFKGIVYDIHA